MISCYRLHVLSPRSPDRACASALLMLELQVTVLSATFSARDRTVLPDSGSCCTLRVNPIVAWLAILADTSNRAAFSSCLNGTSTPSRSPPIEVRSHSLGYQNNCP